MSEDKIIEKEIIVKGIVQGVGFRPFIYRLAKINNLKGNVNNTSSGVYIRVQGDENSVNKFILEIESEAPEVSSIREISVEEKSLCIYKDFTILRSKEKIRGITLISPDIGTCGECMQEVLKEYESTRFLYPFTNCTNCGPRFSIIKKVPYDRINTTMKKFEMCERCSDEYNNPMDRRFHAEPTCCSKCGPVVQVVDKKGIRLDNNDPIEVVRKLLKLGAIVAIKGIGGFNLVCNGKDEKAIENLRKRKHRPKKPLAVMMREVEEVEKYCYIDDTEKKVLQGNKKPIVLLKRKEKKLPLNIAFENERLGVLLPYSPLHYLLFDEDLAVLVFTSGNYSGSSILYENEKAIENLKDIADYFLIHNRDINMSIDDSVVKVVKGKEQIIRGGRGYFPKYLEYKTSKRILAYGSELKNTFALSLGDYIYMSPYIGDLETVEVQENFNRNLKHIKEIYNMEEELVAYDMHPNYWSQDLIKNIKFSKVGVYHHHAHIVSCMVENHVKEDVIGIAFDGIGYGCDGRLWGGEFLICNYKSFVRGAHLKYMIMPGGDGATRNPWIMGISLAYVAFQKNSDEVKKYLSHIFKLNNIDFALSILKSNYKEILSSSMGRLFDGVASFLGFEESITFEGEGAIYIENLAKNCTEKVEGKVYEYTISYKDDTYILDVDKMIKSILVDISNEVENEFIARKFHNTLIRATCEICKLLRKKFNLNKVVLSGGVFQNEILSMGLCEELKKCSFEVITHNSVPCNDSGIALGQLIIANELFKE